jgi:uncharacterized protein YeaO (DUF488 family)
MIRIKRTYEPPARDDGKRVLVERLWPRGMKKEALVMDAWVKDAAPTTELRQWFAHDVERWDEFRRRYLKELKANRSILEPILEFAGQGTVTLLYSAHDTLHNGAVVLRDYLVDHMTKRTRVDKRAVSRPTSKVTKTRNSSVPRHPRGSARQHAR